VQALVHCEGKKRESRNDVYDRKSFYDAHCTVHTAHTQCTVHRAKCTLHSVQCTVHREVAQLGGGWRRLKHENGRNCCFLMLSLSLMILPSDRRVNPVHS